MKRDSARYIAQKNISQRATGRLIRPGEPWEPIGNTPDEIQLLLDMGVIRRVEPDETQEDTDGLPT